ncbi:hypothetical protein [Brachybacterium alimentarium]|nr:hypothetical protein [Brachybacterium alimentarium]
MHRTSRRTVIALGLGASLALAGCSGGNSAGGSSGAGAAGKARPRW